MTPNRRTITFRNPFPADSSEEGKLAEEFLEAHGQCDPLASEAIDQIRNEPSLFDWDEDEFATEEEICEKDFEMMGERFSKLLAAWGKRYAELVEESNE